MNLVLLWSYLKSMKNQQVYNITSEYSNNYYGSKYNHWDFKIFKDLNLVDHKGKHPYFHKYLRNKGYVSGIHDYDLLLTELINYYRDLNEVLKRCSEGCLDHMFYRFAYKATMFKYENAFSTVLNCWDEAFNDACKRYYELSHKTFDESYEISYVAFFDTHFSNHFRYTLMYTDLNFNAGDDCWDAAKNIEIYRLSWLNNPDNLSNLRMHSQPQYLGDLMQEELWLYQNFSPKLLSKL
jgi:hypothetical protein